MKDTDDISARKLIDKLVPDPRWGATRGILSTTYDLGSDFLEMDFLPSVFGLGAWDDRSRATRIALEKHLSQLDAAVILTGVVSMLDKFPCICYNRLWTYCLLGGSRHGKDGD